MATVYRKIKVRRDSQANFAGVILSAGEFGFITDTGLLYIGNGSDDVGGDLIPVNGGLIVDSLYEMATAKILGRTSVGTGPVQELSSVPASLGGTGQAGGYTKGDLLVATGATTLVKLPIGEDNQILRAASGETAGLKWDVETPQGFDNPMTAAGSLIVGGTAGNPEELRIESTDVDGYVLTIIAGMPGWAPAASGLPEIDTTALPGYTILLDTSLQPYWGPISDQVGMENPMSVAGSLIVGGTGGAPYALLPGNELEILTIIDGEPVWMPPVSGLPEVGTGDLPGYILRLDTNGDAYWDAETASSGGGGGGGGLWIDTTPPVDPDAFPFWWDSTSGVLKIYYDSTWVDASPGSSGGSSGGVGGTLFLFSNFH